MDSIKKVIDYLWQDESRHFFEEGALADNHIFIDLIKAKIWHFKRDHSYGLKAYMQAESPFDLASEEDNAYRNLVDKLTN